MRISSKDGSKIIKNKSFDNKSVISSDYIFLKNGNVKRKRTKNSYFETFLEKRRMAAEFAQSKRCYSTISTKIQHINKNTQNKNKVNNKLSYQGLQEIINMNNLRKNLPGKATSIIDNTDKIIRTNYDNEINEEDEENFENMNLNKNDNFFSQNNINIDNKNNKSDDLNQPYFDEIRHLTNKSNANNEITNNLIPPYELENDNNEETSKFGNEVRIIDTNKSRKIEMIPEKHFEIINKNKYDKLKNSVSTYIKKRPIREENNQVSNLMQSKNTKFNSNESNPVNISVSFRNDFNKNNNNNVYNENKKNDNKSSNENFNFKDLNIKYNENKNNDMNRYVETNNEENENNIEFFKDNEKLININNKNNENNNENNNNDGININTNTNNTINTQNDASNDIIEETNVIKSNENNSNEIENQEKKEDNNLNNKLNIYITENNLKHPFKTLDEENKSIKVNKNEEKKIVNKAIETSEKKKENKIQKNNKNSFNFKNYEKVNIAKINIIHNSNVNNNNNQNSKNNTKNFSKIIRTKNSQKNEKNENKNYYSLLISKDIEKLNKLKQSSQRSKETNYFSEINNFIDNMKKKRENKNNNYINLTNENREKLIELQNQKQDLKLFQNQINNALNYNKNKVSFHSTKNFNNIHKNINFNDFNIKKTSNDCKVKISTRMQGLLNKLEKEKISNNVEKLENNPNEINEEENNNKRIFTQNVINSINQFLETDNSGIISNNQINHINNINNNNHNNNFILLQNYYSNENNYINHKKSKKNNFNFVSFDDVKKSNTKNINTEREKNNFNNKNIQLNKNDINVLSEKINKLIKTKNNRGSRSRPNIETNLNLNNRRISFLNDDKYKILNNNSKKYDKSSDFLEGHFFFDKLNFNDKNRDIESFKSKSKMNWNSLNLFGINNKLKFDEDNSKIKIMPVNSIKNLF